MPTYDYECEACGHTQEIFQRITEAPLTKCPECGKKKFKRLFGTGAAVVFKGSGFYQTDYRSESYKKAAEKEAKASEPPSKTESDSGGKSESKSDTAAQSDKSPKSSASDKPKGKKKDS